MKKYFSWILLFIGIFSITAGAVFGNTLVLKASQINGRYGFNKVWISLKDTSNEAFTLQDIKILEKILEANEITFIAHVQTQLTENNGDNNIHVYGTNDKYIDFYEITFKHGFFFDHTAQLENEKTIVVDEKLAWEAFGSLDVLGKSLELFNESFKIRGVFSNQESMISIFSEPKEPYIYMPAQLLLELDENAKITSLQIEIDQASKNISSITNALKEIGKDIDDYSICDYTIQKRIMEQKSLLILFIVGSICIFNIIQYNIKKIRKTFKFIHMEWHKDYLVHVIKKHYLILFRQLLILLFSVLFVYTIWRMIKFNFYIAPQYIPKELTNIGFFGDLLKEHIWNSFTNDTYNILPQIKMKNISLFLNGQFYATIFIGIPLIYIGFYQLKLEQNSFYAASLKVSYIFIIVILLTIFFIFLSGMPIALEISKLIIIFLFIYVNAIIFLKNGEENRL